MTTNPRSGTIPFLSSIRPRALILGAGIAGLGTALAFSREGWSVRIIERRAGPDEPGAGVVLWPVDPSPWDVWGVGRDVQQRSGPIRSMHQYTARGQTELDSFSFAERFGRPGLEGRSILRQDLRCILEGALSQLEVKVEYGTTVLQVDSTGAYLDSESEPVQADVIVGAEGRMASCARRFVRRRNSDSPVFQGFVNLVGVHAGPAPGTERAEIVDFLGNEARFGWVPIDRTRSYWAAGIKATREEAAQPERVLRRLTAEVSTYDLPILRLFEASNVQAQDLIWAYDVEASSAWFREHVVLVGDAAHATLPTAGQGATQALVDASTLVDLLNATGDLSALPRFRDQRFDQTSALILAGRRLARRLF